MLAAIAALNPRDVFRQDYSGEQINPHVIVAPKEPEPDYEEMRRLVCGDQKSVKEETHRDAKTSISFK